MTQEQLTYYYDNLYSYMEEMDSETDPADSAFSEEERSFLRRFRRLMNDVEAYRKDPTDPEAFRKMKEKFAAIAAMEPKDPWKSTEAMEKGDYILAASLYRIQQAVKAENETLKTREKGGEPLETLLSGNYSRTGGTLLRDQQEQYDRLLADAGALADLERELKEADSAFIPSSKAFKTMMTALHETNRMIAGMSEKPDPAKIQALRMKMKDLSAKAMAYEMKKLNEGKGSDYAKKRTDLASKLIGKVGTALGDVSALSVQSMAEQMGGYEKEEQDQWIREDNIRAQIKEDIYIDSLTSEEELSRNRAMCSLIGLEPAMAKNHRGMLTHLLGVFGTEAEKFPGDPALKPQERKMAYLQKLMDGSGKDVRQFVRACGDDFSKACSAADKRDRARGEDESRIPEGDKLRGEYYQEAIKTLNTLAAMEPRLSSRNVEIMSCCHMLAGWAKASKHMANSRKFMEGASFKPVKTCTEGSIQMGKLAYQGIKAKRQLMRMPDDAQVGGEELIADLLTMKAAEVFTKESSKDVKQHLANDQHAHNSLQTILGGYQSNIAGNETGSALDANLAMRQTKAYQRLCQMDMKELKKIVAEDGETLHRFGQAAVQELAKTLGVTNNGTAAKSAQTERATTKLLGDENSKKNLGKGMGQP